jgi:hypothetical protein
LVTPKLRMFCESIGGPAYRAMARCKFDAFVLRVSGASLVADGRLPCADVPRVTGLSRRARHRAHEATWHPRVVREGRAEFREANHAQSPMYADGNSSNSPSGAAANSLAIQSGGPAGTSTTAKALEASRAVAMDGAPSKQKGSPSPHYSSMPGKAQAAGLLSPPSGPKNWA